MSQKDSSGRGCVSNMCRLNAVGRVHRPRGGEQEPYKGRPLWKCSLHWCCAVAFPSRVSTRKGTSRIWWGQRSERQPWIFLHGDHTSGQNSREFNYPPCQWSLPIVSPWTAEGISIRYVKWRNELMYNSLNSNRVNFRLLAISLRRGLREYWLYRARRTWIRFGVPLMPLLARTI